ncbi:MAG: hypothetical protein A2Z72_00485 [Omnitrophica bacterium RBG_13_46_9]|nr:MAG: hypothetical protein A2Z72_00485 [Omnitrophica bacterium RBG_13_46_9]
MGIISLKEVCEQAMNTGINIDLSDCPYGETTGPCAFISRPANYYFFLAGFVKSQGLTHILEIGTNYGGSIMSINKGVHKGDMAQSRLVTVDIICKNKEGFSKYPHIRRIQGDSLDEEVVRNITESFDREVDLLYIDSVHEYEHTRENIKIYNGKLNPRYVILDDIRQSEGMRKLWNELTEAFRDDAFDASDISIRKGAGFGVIRRR